MTKRKLLLIMALLGCVALAAQGPNSVEVPLTNPSQPVNLTVSMVSGSVTVIGSDGNQVVVDSSRPVRSQDRPVPEEAAGLRRIDLGGSGLRIDEQDNEVTITASPVAASDLTIRVPRSTSVNLKLVNGGITIENLDGEINANTTNGRLTLENVSGSAIGHSLNGKIIATFDSVTAGRPMSFTSLNGDIDVTLPADVRARFKMKSDNADIYTDFDMEVENGPAEQPTRSEDGRYRIRLDRTVYGTVNGGGPDYQFTSMNGAILIRKK